MSEKNYTCYTVGTWSTCYSSPKKIIYNLCQYKFKDISHSFRACHLSDHGKRLLLYGHGTYTVGVDMKRPFQLTRAEDDVNVWIALLTPSEWRSFCGRCNCKWLPDPKIACCLVNKAHSWETKHPCQHTACWHVGEWNSWKMCFLLVQKKSSDTKKNRR